MNSHQKSIVLMRWLSQTCKRLGVAEHTYVVGGAVRNWVLQAPIKDLDVALDPIASGRDSEWLAREIQKGIPVKSTLVTNTYGVAILSVSGDWVLDGLSLQGEVLEIANARKESYGGAEGKGYKPHIVEPATIQEDLARREFSFNTLMWRLQDLASGPDKAEILDLTGCGLQDLKDGVMRCPGGNPVKTFRDDPTRILRLVKFALRYNFKPTADVLKAVAQTKQHMKNMPHNAITKLLMDVLELSVPKSLSLMQSLDLIVEIQGILKSNRAAMEAMSNWAQHRSVVDNLALLDAGLPVANWITRILKRLNPADRDRFIHIMGTLSSTDAMAWCQAVNQPGRVLDMENIIVDYHLSGRDIRRVDDALLKVLLDSPTLLQFPQKLETLVRGIL